MVPTVRKHAMADKKGKSCSKSKDTAKAEAPADAAPAAEAPAPAADAPAPAEDAAAPAEGEKKSD